jgi:hypothetical protein
MIRITLLDTKTNEIVRAAVRGGIHRVFVGELRGKAL